MIPKQCWIGFVPSELAAVGPIVGGGEGGIGSAVFVAKTGFVSEGRAGGFVEKAVTVGRLMVGVEVAG